MDNQKSNPHEPYLHGNPWLIVLFMSVLPLSVLLSTLFDIVGLLLALFVGIPSTIFALIYLTIAFRTTHWTKLSAMVTIALILITFLGMPMLFMHGHLWGD